MNNSSDISRYSFIRGNARIQAALEIAEEAHAKGEPRQSGEPYIEHPLLVARILDKFGCTSKQIAVALLHDVVEERDDLYPGVAALEAKLIRKLEEHCQPRSEAEKEILRLWAENVCEGVRQLTNGALLYEGKRTWQVDHALEISPEFRPVKIIDQAASVIDDIRYCNPRNPSSLKFAKGFALKGLDVSRACRGDDHNNPFHEFYKRVYTYFIKNYESAQAGDFIAYAQRQGDFDTERNIADAKAPVRREQVKAEEVIHYYDPDYYKGNLKEGLARITVSQKEGVVVGFGVVVSPEEDGKAAANAVAKQLCDVLEERKNVWVRTGALEKPSKARKPSEQGLEKHAAMFVRDYTLPEPLPLNVFLTLANEANAISAKFRFGKFEDHISGEIQIVSR